MLRASVQVKAGRWRRGAQREHWSRRADATCPYADDKGWVEYQPVVHSDNGDIAEVFSDRGQIARAEAEQVGIQRLLLQQLGQLLEQAVLANQVFRFLVISSRLGSPQEHNPPVAPLP